MTRIPENNHSSTTATRRTSADPARPFGAHLSLRWWVPVVLTITVIIATNVLQTLLVVGAALIDVGLLGQRAGDTSLTPLQYLASNVAIILVAPLTLLVLARIGRAPWRAVFSRGRHFRWRRLATYLGIFAVLMVVTNIAIHVVNPSPIELFAISGTTIALLTVVLVTTPLQAASEEIVFRGILTPSYASWVRASRPAIILGITGSSILFMVLHMSTDLWMIVNYLGLGVSTALMALLSRGLEAPIAFHVMNNVFAMTIGALFAEGGGISQDRTAGSAGPYLLLVLVAEAIAVVIVWQMEKRRASSRKT
ncbi:MAG: lysostaphin resistance A-like protein [Microbacterium sp.]